MLKVTKKNKEIPPVMTSWKMHLKIFILNHQGICTVISTCITKINNLIRQKKNSKMDMDKSFKTQQY